MTAFSPDGTAAPTAPTHPRDSRPDAPSSVAMLNQTVHDFVMRWGAVWVEGEITSWNARSSAVYGRLKDVSQDASLSFRIWSSVRNRLPADLKVGDRVIACVKPDYYVRGGDLSFAVSDMRKAGLGDQLEKLERLRAQLRAEGLFAPERKKPLPFLPQCIGLITGERSDAEKDVLRNARLRWPQVKVRTRYAAVQGDRSVPEILAALAALDADPEVDVIIITRGGGDPQTLLGFSDEKLVRAVAAASTPVVSAIGHENDHPILDEVADLRASTPTDAAKRVVPDVQEQRALVAQLRARMITRLSTRISHDISQLEQLRTRPVLREPESMLAARSQDLWLLLSRGRDTVDRQVRAQERAVAELRASLRALSPGATLERGYAVLQLPDRAIVRDAAQAPAGTTMTVTVSHGTLTAVSQGGSPDVLPASPDATAPSPPNGEGNVPAAAKAASEPPAKL